MHPNHAVAWATSQLWTQVSSVWFDGICMPRLESACDDDYNIYNSSPLTLAGNLFLVVVVVVVGMGWAHEELNQHSNTVIQAQLVRGAQPFLLYALLCVPYQAYLPACLSNIPTTFKQVLCPCLCLCSLPFCCPDKKRNLAKRMLPDPRRRCLNEEKVYVWSTFFLVAPLDVKSQKSPRLQFSVSEH